MKIIMTNSNKQNSIMGKIIQNAAVLIYVFSLCAAYPLEQNSEQESAAINALKVEGYQIKDNSIPIQQRWV